MTHSLEDSGCITGGPGMAAPSIASLWTNSTSFYYLSLSRQWILMLRSTGMWRSAAPCRGTNTSQEYVASIFKAEQCHIPLWQQLQQHFGCLMFTQVATKCTLPGTHPNRLATNTITIKKPTNNATYCGGHSSQTSLCSPRFCTFR